MSADPAVESESLLAERDFLLRSLDDLEEERAAGNLDEETHAQLRDDYTARAAAVLRSIEDGRDQRSARARPPRRARRATVVTVVAVVVFAVVAGVVLARSLGSRQEGELPSGNVSTATEEERLASLNAQVEDDPDNLALRLSYAQRLETSGRALEALQQYDAVLAREPGNADALAASGWLLYRVAAQAGGSDPAQTAELFGESRARLERAIAADPEAAEARFFYGVVLFRGYGDAAAAIPQLQQFLAAEGDNPLAPQVRDLLAEAEASVTQPT